MKNIPQGQFCLHCNAWRGSLGLEPTIELYLSHLYAIFDEVRRCLKDEGTLFINLGDNYGGSGGCKGHTPESENKGRKTFEYGAHHGVTNYKAKSLCLIPQRFAIGMIERDWICRNVLIWHKPNPMPSSASDRFTVDFEYVYFFVKQGRYYFEQQFEAQSLSTINHAPRKTTGPKYVNKPDLRANLGYSSGPQNMLPQGRNKRCVMTIPTESFRDAHFSTYPKKLIEPLIRAGCPEFVCKKCGKGREKVWRKEGYEEHPQRRNRNVRNKADFNGDDYSRRNNTLGLIAKINGYELSDCGCGEPFIPGLILDPFLGSGTTALVALSLNRNYIGIELSDKYVKMAQDRLNKPIQVKL